jgi:short-subunit dehydrogenase
MRSGPSVTVLRERWCLVTGAASGIGRGVAEALADEGALLVLVDCNEANLARAASELAPRTRLIQTFTCDVSSKEDVERVRSSLAAQGVALEILVNNAGILRTGGILDTSLADFEAVLAVNLMGVIHMTKAFAPSMVARRTGAIVNIASASGLVAFCQLGAYSTSKFAVVGFSEALRAELSGSGVEVLLVCPGIVKTPIATNSGIDAAEAADIERLLSRSGYPAAQAARGIVRALQRRQALLLIGSDATFLSWAARLAPRRASRWLRSVAARRATQVRS